MYGIEYEDDILLLLRMIKFLHMKQIHQRICKIERLVVIRRQAKFQNDMISGDML